MTADRYFDKFPIITYSNNSVVDITRRVVLLDRVSRNPYAFYPYEIEDNERPDQFSDRYYDDSYKSWMVYLANKINDPYYEWYLTGNEFNEFIEKKYGSIYEAQQRVKFYRNNWENQDNISLSEYNALPIGNQKYWDPEYGSGSSVIYYKRKEIDWTTSTNKIVSYTVANTSFTKNEIVNIKLNSNAIGKGQITGSTNNTIYVQHVSGEYNESASVSISSGYIYGTESNVNTAVTDVTVLSSNIPDEQVVYWTAITHYDYEMEKNEYNKSVRIIDKEFQYVVVDNLIDLLKDTN